MSMTTYRLRGQLDEAIDAENWTEFVRLWRELIPTDWSYRIGTSKKSHTQESIDRFIPFLLAGYPTYLMHKYAGDQELSVLRHFSCQQLNDSEGRICFTIHIGHGILNDIQITGPVLDCDLSDLKGIYRKGTLTCHPQVLRCLYPPALSLLLKVVQNKEGNGCGFLALVLDAVREAYVAAVTAPEALSSDPLENLIAVLPDIGKMPAIAAMQAGNARAAHRLFDLLSRLHYFEAYDYSVFLMQDRRVLDLSRELSLSSKHSHQAFVAGQCVAFCRLMTPALHEKLDLAHLEMVTRLLAEELRAYGHDWVGSDWFVGHISAPLYTVRDVVMWHYCRIYSLYSQEPHLENPLPVETYIAMFNLLGLYVEAVSTALCSSAKPGRLSVVLNTLREVCKHVAEIPVLGGEYLAVFEENRQRLEGKLYALEYDAPNEANDQDKAAADQIVQETSTESNTQNNVNEATRTPKGHSDELSKPNALFADLAKWLGDNEAMTAQRLRQIDASAQQYARMREYADNIVNFIDDTGVDTPEAGELRAYARRMSQGENPSPDEMRNFWLRSRLTSVLDRTVENLNALWEMKGVRLAVKNGRVEVDNL